MNKSFRKEVLRDTINTGVVPADDYYPLEERILFDGAAAVEAADTLQDSLGEDAAAVEAAGQQEQEQAGETLASAAAEMPDAQANEIYFIDAGISNADTLIAAISDGAEVVMIDSSTDGVELIASVLEGRNDVEAIHILSHGQPGQIELGNTTLDAASIAGTYADELAVIGAALSENADILIYGCDFGQDEATLMALADATGADVAASDDDTGNETVGGDWDLESHSGIIETSSYSAEKWVGLLGPGISVLDSNGNDDWNNPERADITAVTIDYSQVASGTLTASLQFDAVSDPSGGINGGLLFDTDGDGNANVLVLVALEPDPTTGDYFISGFTFNEGANDSRPDKIAGKTTTTNPTISTAVLSTASNPFITGDQDSLVTFTINLAELGGVPTDTALLNAVTTASASPTSDVKDILLDSSLAPSAADDSANVSQNDSVIMNVVSNDIAVGINTIVVGDGINGLLQPSNGSVVANADGTITYTPAPGFTGSDSFEYQVTGIDGQTYTATSSVTVIPVINDPPVAVSDSFTILEDTSSSALNLTGNDTDADGDTLSVASIAGTTITPGTAQAITVPNGTVNVSATGVVTFTPDADYNGPVSFDYVVSDGNGGTDTGSVSGTVTPLNDPPVAGDDSVTTAEDSPVVLDPVGSGTASDADGDALTITQVDGQPITAGGAAVTVTGGTVVLQLDGTLVFTPAADFNGPASFAYTVSDPSGATDSGVLSVAVEPLPEGGVIAVSTAEDSPVAVNPLADEDAGDVASVRLDGPLPNPATEGTFTYTDGTGATVTVSGPVTLTPAEAATLVFTPAPDFNGVVPTVATTITDSNGDTANGAIAITVTPVNDPPVADDETFTVLQDSGATVIDVLDGDTDVDGDDLSITQVDGQAVTAGAVSVITLSDGSGTVTVDDTGAAPVVSFTPTAGYNGPSSFTYTIVDPTGAATTASVTGEVDPVAVPAALVADTPEDTAINVDPTEGQAPGAITEVRVDSLPLATHGTLSYSSDGGGTVTLSAADLGGANALLSPTEAVSLTFTPVADFNGQVTDGVDTLIDFTLISAGPDVTATYDLTVTPVNDPPVADNDSFAMNEDGTPVVIDVLDGDTDVDDLAADLRVTEINGVPVVAGNSVDVGNGTATLNADGTISFVPDADYNGPLSFGYTVSDPTGGTDTGTVTGTIEPLPEGGVIAVSTAEDSPVAVNPLADEDPTDIATVSLDGPFPNPATEGTFTYTDGTGATVTVSGPVTLTPAEAATLVFTPAPDFNGVVPTVATTITDSNGDTANGAIAITVTPVNDPPVAVSDSFTILEDTSSSALNLTGNDTDADGDTLSVASIAGTTITPGTAQAITVPNGTVNVSATGVVTFTPDADYNGPVSFDYVVSDGNGGTDTGSVSGTVTPLNDPPVAGDDSVTTAEDSPVVLDPVGSGTASDADGDALTITQVDGQPITAGGAAVTVTGGTVVLQLDGTLVFTPAADFNGPASFAYTVSDPSGATDSGVLSVAVEPLPEGGVIAVSTAEDSPVAVNPLADEDAGDVASVRLDGPLPNPATEGTFTYTDGTGATVTVSGPVTLTPAEAATLVFTPAPDFNGVVPTVATTITDSNGDTANGAIAITVTPVNDPPVADDETFTVLQDSGATVIDVLDGDTDVDGDDLSITQVDGQAVTAGAVSVITLSDGSGTVTVDDTGAAPVVSFTPTAGYNGPSSFTYTIVDPTGAATTASVTGEVDPVAVPAALVADTPEDTAINVDPTEGQAPGAITEVRVDSLPLATHGTLSYSSDGGGTVTLSAADLGGANALLSPTEAVSLTFTPVADFNGQVTDGVDTLIDFTLISAGPDVTATYDLTVTPVNDPPVADNDSFAMNEDGTPVVIDVLDGDTDVDDLAADLRVTEINGVPVVAGNSVDVGNGTATLNADGTISFVPDADYNGPLSFGYTVSDPTGGTDTGTVTGTIEPLPEGGVIAVSTAEDSPVAVNPLADEDPTDIATVSLDGPFPNPATEGTFTYTDGTGATVTVSGPVTLTPAEAATLVFTPAPDFNGVVPTVATTITDSNGDTANGAIAITVTPVNDPPVAVSDSFTILEDTSSSALNLTGNDTDADGDTLSVASIAGTTITPGTAQAITVPNGTVNVSATGVVTFTPDADYNGPVSFDYVVSDGNGGTDTGSVSGTVTPLNDPPVAGDDSVTTAEDSPVVLDPVGSGTASDADGDALTITQVDGQPITAGGAAVTVTGGTVVLQLDGTLVFTPAADFNGPASFAYTVSDPSGATDSGVLSVAVEPLPEGGVIAVSTAEDSPVAVNPLADEDAGDVASVRLDGPLPNPATEGTFTYTDGTGATVTVSGPVTLTPAEAATLVFTPAPDFNGVVPTVATTITDSNGDTANGAIAITVTPVNDPPVADDETFTVLQDSGATVIDVLDGDTDVDGDDLSITQVDGQAVTAGAVSVITLSDGSGTVTVDDTGAAPVVSFTPTAGYNGPSSFTYTIVDPTGAATTASVTGEVDPVAVPAALVADTPEDTAINVDPTEGQAPGAITEVRVDSLPLATHGTLSYSSDGGGTVTLSAADLGGANALLSPTEAVSLTFTPVADFNGQVTDGVDTLIDFTLISAGPDVTATYDLTVTPVNDPPVADNDSFAMNEDGTPVVIDVLDGDTDVDDLAADLRVTEINGVPVVAGNSVDVGNGTATLNADGTISFVPDADYNGPLSFGYTVSDPTGGTDTGTVTGTIEPLPEGGVIAVSTAEDSPVAVNPLADEDPTDIATVSLDGPFPNPATEGTFTYTDGTGATVTVSGPVTLTPAEAATLVFTPAPDFNGVVPTVATTITDSNGDTANGAIAITVTPVNDPPVAVSDSFTILEDTSSSALNLTGNDTDADGDTLSVASIAGTTITPGTAQAITVPNGTVNVSATGVVTFTPDADYNGPVSFDYVVSDGNGGTDTGSVSGTVTPLNDPPVAGDDSVTTAEDSPVVLDPVGSGTASDADGDALTITQVDGQPITAGGAAVTVTGGTVVLQLDGTLVFTPAADFNGPASFAYTVSDPSGATDSGVLSVAVEPLPEGGVIAVSTAEDSPVAVNPLADEDAGDVASVRLDGPLPNPATEGTFTYTDGTGATVTVSGPVTLTPAEAATLVFTPAPDFNGVVPTVATTITDSNGDTANGAIAITVTPVNDNFIDNSEVVSVDENSGLNTGNLIDGSSVDGPVTVKTFKVDIEGNGSAESFIAGDTAMITDVGMLKILADGTYNFTPAVNYAGSVPLITYVLTDGSGADEISTLSITVDPVPEPVPGNSVALQPEDIPAPEREPLIVDHMVTETANAAASLNGITPLLSGLNTNLAAKHPIMTAIDGLQDLNGTPQLNTVNGGFFAGNAADGPILQAVEGVGFAPLVDQHDPFGQAFPESAGDIDDLVTRSGYLISLSVLDGDAAPMILAQVWSPTGETELIRSMTFETLDGEIFGDLPAVLSDSSEAQVLVNIELATGQEIQLDVHLTPGAGKDIVAKISEVEPETFSEQTKRFAQRVDYETARLMQAIRGS